jgi:hypothetical protein
MVITTTIGCCRQRSLAGDTVNYAYNAFGERSIRAIAGGDTQHLQYGPNGELLTETDISQVISGFGHALGAQTLLSLLS